MNWLLRRNAYVLLLLSTSFYAYAQNSPKIEHGTLDLRYWDFSTGKIALAGDWLFYENQLVTDPQKDKNQLLYFPEVWAKSGRENMKYATYCVAILLPENANQLGLEIPQLYSSYALLINGKVVAQNGQPGTSKENTLPQWMPQVVSFDHANDTLQIVLQVANFHHYHGGAKQPIYLGNAPILQQYRTLAVKSNVTECIMLFVIGLAFFVIYYVRQERKKITLYFSLLCLSWALRSLFSNDYLFISYFPHFDWTWMVRIEYITLYLMLIWAALFISKLFPGESSMPVKYILVVLNCIFILETLVTAPSFFTEWIIVYLLTAGLLLVHSLIVAIRALINERSGVWYLVISIMLCLVIFSYDIFVFEGFFQYYDALFFSMGYVIIFILLAMALFYHLKIFKGDGSSGTLTFDELYGSESLKERN